MSSKTIATHNRSAGKRPEVPTNAVATTLLWAFVIVCGLSFLGLSTYRLLVAVAE